MTLTPERPKNIPDFGVCRSQTNNCYEDDGIIIKPSVNKQKRRPAKPKPRKDARKISLKFRCQMDVHKIPVLSVRHVKVK